MLKKLFPPVWFCLTFTVFFFSCAGAPQVKETSPNGASGGALRIDNPNAGNPPAAVTAAPIGAPVGETMGISVETPREEMLPETLSADAAPETTDLPIESGSLATFESPVKRWKQPVPEYIMGTGLIKPEDLSDFLLYTNPRAEKGFVENLANLYAEEAAIEGVNHDTAFAQMCLETGFLRFGGLVTPDMYNFCGLGATGPGVPGNRFPDPRTGVRAHIQHLKAYATDTPLKQELVDPRYHYVRYGSSPAIKGLAGTWAADLLYAEKINGILERLYFFVLGI